MSILGYAGLPGHGKSYSVVENVVLPALKAGRVLYHNLKLNPLALAVVCDKPVEHLLVQIAPDWTAAQLVERCPPGAVIVIDEIWRYWPAGMKTDEVPAEQLAFFKEHRHRVGADGHSSEIVIIDQSFGSGVARFIRDLIEMTYLHHKHTALGATKNFRVDVFSRCVDASKASRKSGSFIRSLQGTYKSQVWNCYISHTQNESKIGEAGLEKLADARGSIWKSYSIKLAAGALLVIPMLAWAAWSSFWSLGQPKKPLPVSRQTVVGDSGPQERPKGPLPPGTEIRQDGTVILPATAVAPLPPPAKRDSLRWTLRGFIDRDGVRVAIIESANGSRSIPAALCRIELTEQICEFDGDLIGYWTGNPIEKFTKAEAYNPAM